MLKRSPFSESFPVYQDHKLLYVAVPRFRRCGLHTVNMALRAHGQPGHRPVELTISHSGRPG